MILGITGKAQSGKDTACKIIQATHAYRNSKINFWKKEFTEFEFIKNSIEQDEVISLCKKHAFADALKECASLILGENRFMFEENSFKESPTSLELYNKDGERMTNRQFLQYFGTEVGRAIDEDLWVKVLMNKYQLEMDNWEREIDSEPIWIVPDVRFPNEAEAIRKAGGQIWKIERPGVEPVSPHVSEQLIDSIPYDIVIENSQDLDAYIKCVIMAYNTTFK